MHATIRTAPRRTSRAKMGLSILGVVLAALVAGQVAASPSGGHFVFSQAIAR